MAKITKVPPTPIPPPPTIFNVELSLAEMKVVAAALGKLPSQATKDGVCTIDLYTDFEVAVEEADPLYRSWRYFREWFREHGSD